MRVFILSKQEMAYLARTPKWRQIFNDCAFISINDVGCKSPVTDEGTNLLILHFSDIEQGFNIQTGSNHILFSQKNAVDIVTFAKENLDKSIVFVHCYAGESRSGAVGKFLNIYFNIFMDKNKKDYEWFNKRYGESIDPNRLVEKLLFENIYSADI